MSAPRSPMGPATSRSTCSPEPVSRAARVPRPSPRRAPERIAEDRVIAPGQLSSLNAEGRGLGSNRISADAPARPARGKPEWVRPMAQRSSVGAKGWATATLAGVVAGLIAAHVLPPSSPAAGASGAVGTAVLVDRSHKGDRLDAAFL